MTDLVHIANPPIITCVLPVRVLPRLINFPLFPAAFILEVVARHGEASPRLCNKVRIQIYAYFFIFCPLQTFLQFVLIFFSSLLAGSIHSEVWHLFEETVSKFQIFIYGPRWSGHSALDYYSKSHYYGIRFEILPTKFDQVEFCHFSNERPV